MRRYLTIEEILCKAEGYCETEKCAKECVYYHHLGKQSIVVVVSGSNFRPTGSRNCTVSNESQFGWFENEISIRKDNLSFFFNGDSTS